MQKASRSRSTRRSCMLRLSGQKKKKKNEDVIAVKRKGIPSTQGKHGVQACCSKEVVKHAQISG